MIITVTFSVLIHFSYLIILLFTIKPIIVNIAMKSVRKVITIFLSGGYFIKFGLLLGFNYIILYYYLSDAWAIVKWPF
jgi:hypothetical protein